MEMYVVQTLKHHENKVAENLIKQGFSVYCPAMEMPERRHGKLCRIIRFVFPQYLFVECDLTAENNYIIRNISGVVQILGNENPTHLEQHEKEYIRILNNDGNTIQASEILVDKNGGKSVISGILKRYQDRIVSLDLRSHRAKIQIELCGKIKKITLPIIEA